MNNYLDTGSIVNNLDSHLACSLMLADTFEEEFIDKCPFMPKSDLKSGKRIFFNQVISEIHGYSPGGDYCWVRTKNQPTKQTNKQTKMPSNVYT